MGVRARFVTLVLGVMYMMTTLVVKVVPAVVGTNLTGVMTHQEKNGEHLKVVANVQKGNFWA